MVQLAELSDWCFSNNVPARDRIEKVKGLTSIISLDEDICFEDSRIKNRRRKKGFQKFSLLDGLVLTAAGQWVNEYYHWTRTLSGKMTA